MIASIEEVPNAAIPTQAPVRETMDMYVPGCPEGVSRRNGMVWLITGSGGSGKTNLLLNFFRSKKLYRGRFHHVWLIVPEGSYNSVVKHPFAGHDRVYHELTPSLIQAIYEELMTIKKEQESPEYSLVIIDDFANELKRRDIQAALAKLVIKLRHLQCGLIFTLQSFNYMPKIVRKQVTFFSMFRTRNWAEFESIASELLGYNREDCLKLYRHVFSEKFSHLDLDLVEDLQYKNFNRLVIREKSSPI